MRRLVLAAAIGLGGCAAPQAVTGDAACVIDARDAAWRQAAPGVWALVEREALKQAPMAARPAYVFYDATCAYRSADGRAWRSSVHGGEVKLPDGQGLPPIVASFAAPGADGKPFMAMGLPTIWRGDDVASEMGLEKLMSAVFAHEMAHLLQFGTYSARIDQLGAALGVGDELTDDIVQDRFKDDPAFAASVKQEAELLFSALQGDAAAGRARVREAVALMTARRAKHFTGGNATLNELEDVFLTMEGLGQFAGYAWLVNPKGGGLTADMALPGMRRGGRHWSQDEGLAIFLVLDRFLPDWQARAFGAKPETALQMLAAVAAN